MIINEYLSISHPALTELMDKISRLEFTLDDLRCYIAEADMKNEELIKSNKKLREALVEALKESE